ncbi:MAG TPA: winged helix-turn-helix domain-containing protein [Nocardioidaceae bacterium]|nr:winged helix-turn-helix domain-containing protein [Nocardioidaceae bacterium]
MHEVWGPVYEKETNYLRVDMANLRRKLEQDPSHPPATSSRCRGWATGS